LLDIGIYFTANIYNSGFEIGGIGRKRGRYCQIFPDFNGIQDLCSSQRTFQFVYQPHRRSFEARPYPFLQSRGWHGGRPSNPTQRTNGSNAPGSIEGREGLTPARPTGKRCCRSWPPLRSASVSGNPSAPQRRSLSYGANNTANRNDSGYELFSQWSQRLLLDTLGNVPIYGFRAEYIDFVLCIARREDHWVLLVMDRVAGERLYRAEGDNADRGREV
jgi:hypothetical protein